jgi:hypothetical protein
MLKSQAVGDLGYLAKVQKGVKRKTLQIMHFLSQVFFNNNVACRLGAHCYSTVTLPIAVS